VKIVKALKKIARLKGEIKELKKRISSSLNTVKGNDFEELFDTLDAELAAKTNEMMGLKEAVMKANIAGGVFGKILKMGELKSLLDFYRELEPKNGVQENWRNDIAIEYVSQLTRVRKNEIVSGRQQEINDISDELDTFNATTDIVI